MLKGYLEMSSAIAAQFDGRPFSDLIRTGNEQALLLSDWPRWQLFREMRGKTSHICDEAVALDVVAEIPAFLEEARHLCTQLQARVA